MIYHLEVEARFCIVKAILNGFPIYDVDGSNPVIFSKPINAALIGKNNSLSFAISSAKPEDIKFEYSIKGSIKQYMSGLQMTGPDQGQKIAEFTYQNLPAAVLNFDNEKFDHSSLFYKSPKIEDRESLLDYAINLKDILQQRNYKLILAEFDPKLSVYSIAYSLDKGILVKQFRDYLNDKYYFNTPILNFSNKQIYFRSWCEKRIWEIGVGPELNPFMQTEPNEDGLEYVTRVFISTVENSLKIVR